MHRATTAAIVNSQLAYLGGHLGELASSANLMRCAAAAAIEQVRRRWWAGLCAAVDDAAAADDDAR